MRKTSSKFKLAVLFAGVVCGIFFATMLVVTVLMFILSRAGAFDGRNMMTGSFGSRDIMYYPMLVFALSCLLVGSGLAFLFSGKLLRPIRSVMTAADKIASGDYTARVEIRGVAEFKQLGESFNHMAQELSSVEMLRSDFVNEFSHEFKTPIVSIRGFAKMLKRDDLTKKERDEYLNIIISESQRLAELSTGVLNMSRLEKQTILTDKQSYNISEQIRQVLALLDSRLEEKHLTVDADFGEITITGNRELLEQAIVNLLDNAIKFSPENGSICLRAVKEAACTCFLFTNDGCRLTADEAAHMFDKFYQGDASHTGQGNGLGLAIARRVVQLHGGTLTANLSSGSQITFALRLPM